MLVPSRPSRELQVPSRLNRSVCVLGVWQNRNCRKRNGPWRAVEQWLGPAFKVRLWGAGAAEVSGSHSHRGNWDPWGWSREGRLALVVACSPFSHGCLGTWRCRHFCVGGETAASLRFAFSARTLLGKESGKPMEVLTGRKLQVALSFVNAPFGVFVWTLPLGVQAGDVMRLTRSPEPWGAAGSTLPWLQRAARMPGSKSAEKPCPGWGTLRTVVSSKHISWHRHLLTLFSSPKCCRFWEKRKVSVMSVAFSVSWEEECTSPLC